MLQGRDHLDRARMAQWILSISGLAILLISFNARWASENYPFFIYLLVALAFVDLGVFAYFLAHLICHLMKARKELNHVSMLTPTPKLLIAIMVIFTVADAIYATITNSWNQFSIVILVALLLGIAAIPFHIAYSEYAQRKVY